MKLLFEALDWVVDAYEKKSGNRMDPLLVKLLYNYVKTHTPLLIDVAYGALEKKHAVAALVRLAEVSNVGLDVRGIDCAVAIFEAGVTGLEWTSTTIKVSRAAGLAAATGVGVPLASATTVAVALFGVLMTTKDFIDAAKACDEVLSGKAVRGKRPAVMIDRRGYSLGQISTGFATRSNFGMEVACHAGTPAGAR